MRHLARIPLDASYPDTVERIGKIIAAPEIEAQERCYGPIVVLDITGSGMPIVGLFERADIRPILVSISGSSAREEQIEFTARSWSPYSSAAKFNDWRIPKIDLVGNLRIMFEAGRLQMAQQLDLVPMLMDELRAFKMRPPRIDPNDPETWREGQSDDLIFAVAVGAWRANRYTPVIKPAEERYGDESRGPDGWMA